MPSSALKKKGNDCSKSRRRGCRLGSRFDATGEVGVQQRPRRGRLPGFGRIGGGGLFFFIDRATTEIYTLSLHDALPISMHEARHRQTRRNPLYLHTVRRVAPYSGDRKSTRLNSSHGYISYAVFCLK